ncbi:MAG TPA: cytochrome c oxidase assembly protein [Candidatus Sulfotelmatobacter sp.]|nr:cytochrome c oxidase assembly protein [Candidatus Sulfotelmatobacter sp.]
MTTRDLLLTTWDWEPSVIIGCGALLVLYFYFVRPRTLWRILCYCAGVIVLLLALISPIDTLSDHYLFSVHMIQHLLLILAVSPLLILGIPAEFAVRFLGRPKIAGAERILSNPFVAWIAAALALGLWHVPVFYNFALAHEGVHVLEHLIFLVTATMFWWPVLTPVQEFRLGAGAAVLYLFLASMFNSILGIIITFAPLGCYPAYVHPQDALGILPLIRNHWGISAVADQQLGGLLMWVPAGLIYFSLIVGTVIRWQSGSEMDLPETQASCITRGEHAA